MLDKQTTLFTRSNPHQIKLVKSLMPPFQSRKIFRPGCASKGWDRASPNTFVITFPRFIHVFIAQRMTKRYHHIRGGTALQQGLLLFGVVICYNTDSQSQHCDISKSWNTCPDLLSLRTVKPTWRTI